jgi:hypothetical protein
LGRSFGLTDARIRVLVAAAAGAGIAAAYNTPIAGTLFVLEVVAGSFATDLIGPTVIAAVTGTLVPRIYLWKGRSTRCRSSCSRTRRRSSPTPGSGSWPDRWRRCSSARCAWARSSFAACAHRAGRARAWAG